MKALFTLLTSILLCTQISAQQFSLLPYQNLPTSGGQEITTLSISEDGSLVAATDKKGLLQIWDIDKKLRKKEIKSKSKYLINEFKETILTTVDDDGLLIMHDGNGVITAEVETKLQPKLVTLDPTKTQITSLNKDGQLDIFDIQTSMGFARIDAGNSGKEAVYLGYDRFGQYVINIAKTGGVNIWDPASQRKLKQLVLSSGEFHGSKSVIHSGTTSKGNNYFIVGLQEVFIPKGGLQGTAQPERKNMVIVYDFETGNEYKRIKTNYRVDQIVAGPGPECLIYMTHGKKDINLVNIATGSIQNTITPDFYPSSLALSSDNTLLAVGGEDGEIVVFEVQRNAAAEIKIIYPPLSRGFVNNQITSAQATLKGTIENLRGISEVTVNSMPAQLSNFSEFSADVALTPGKNKVRIQVLDHENNRYTKDIYLTRMVVEEERKKLESSIPGTSKRKVALVVGNSEYQSTGFLANPIKDANAMEETLKGMGFQVKKLLNASYEEMKNSVFQFGDLIQDVDISIFYYAGHGLEVDGANYLVPVDANLQSALDVKMKTVPLVAILKTVDYANDEGLNMVILDACRNNPFPTGRRGGAGLARESASSGTLIAYATEPGSTASDGEGDNGLYTGELVKQLKINQRIEDVFINTRNNVEQISNGQQKPWEEARLKGIFYLH